MRPAVAVLNICRMHCHNRNKPTGNVRLERNQIGKSWHSAEQSGIWDGLCARQNGDGIAKKEKLRRFGNQILGDPENVCNS